MYLRGRSWVISQCHQSGIQRNARRSVSLFCTRAKIKWALCNERSKSNLRFHEKITLLGITVVRIWLLLSFSAIADISLLSSVLCLDFLRTTGRRFKLSPPEEADATKGLSLLNPKEYFFRLTEVFGGNDAMIIFRLIKEDNCLSSEKAALDYLQPCSKVIRKVY